MDLVTLVLACSLYVNNSIPYAIVQTDSKNDPLAVTVNNVTKHFTKVSEAMHYTKQQIAQNKIVNIGLMQISSQWLPTSRASVDELFRPCKNVFVATQVMNTFHLRCQALAEHDSTIDISACTLSMYKTGNAYTGSAYAAQIIDYAAKHPFAVLAQKARDPGMLAAIAKPGSASSHATV